jgi:serine beta-lactamase-like protein LACTB
MRLLLAFLLALTCGTGAQEVTPALRLEIEDAVRLEMIRQNIPGLSLAVADDGLPRGTFAFGMADIENQVLVKPSTVFRMASISKPVTAVTALQLWEAGKLDLDAPVHRYLPSFPQKAWRVTPRQLLGHQGGVRHYLLNERVDAGRHYFDLASALHLFQEDPLIAEPGTRYNYTTYGFVLLGAVIEAAASNRFIDKVRTRVFQPAGMDSARDDSAIEIIPNRSRGYAVTPEGRLRNCGLSDTSYKIPGGGMIAAPRDLVKFALAIRSYGLLKQHTVEMMFTPQKLKDGRSTQYGMGWFIDAVDGRKAVLHSGDQEGVHSFLVMLPREGVAVAAMCNLEGANLRALSFKIAELLCERN